MQNETLEAMKKIQLSDSKFCVSTIKDLPASIQFRVIKEILNRANTLCDAKKIELIEKAIGVSSGKINLRNNVFCIVKDDVLSIEKVAKKSEKSSFTPVKVTPPGSYKVSKEQELKLMAISIQEYNKKRKKNSYYDYP